MTSINFKTLLICIKLVSTICPGFISNFGIKFSLIQLVTIGVPLKKNVKAYNKKRESILVKSIILLEEKDVLKIQYNYNKTQDLNRRTKRRLLSSVKKQLMKVLLYDLKLKNSKKCQNISITKHLRQKYNQMQNKKSNTMIRRKKTKDNSKYSLRNELLSK